MSDQPDSHDHAHEGRNDGLPEGVDPATLNLHDASEDLLWKVLPHVEGSRRAEALYMLGSRLARNERWEQAVVCAEESIEEWETAENFGAMVHGLMASASCRTQLQDFDEALAHYDRAIPLLLEYGPESELVDAHVGAAGLLEEMGEAERAHAHLLAALEIAERLEEPTATAEIHESLARTLAAGDHDVSEVRGHLIAARQLYSSAKDLAKVLHANDRLARHFDECDDYTAALVYLEENIHIATTLGRSDFIGTAHYRYAGALRLCDRAQDAFTHIDTAREHLQNVGDHERVLWCDLEQLWCLQRLGRRRATAELLERLWVTVRIIGSAAEVHSIATDVYAEALSSGETTERLKVCEQTLAWARDHMDEPRSATLIQQFTIETALTYIDNDDMETAAAVLASVDDLDVEDVNPDIDALLQTARAHIDLAQGDAPSAAMTLAGVSPDESLPPVTRARVLTIRGRINEDLVKGSGVADLAAAAQIWTNLGFRSLVTSTLDLLSKRTS